MSLLREGSVNNDGLVFRQGFRLRREIQDQAGVLVGCSVGLGGPGIKPTNANSRVNYDQSRSWLINRAQMTIRMRFRMFSQNNATAKRLMCKCPNGLNDNQFFVQFSTGRILSLYVASAFNDFANYSALTNALTTSQTYIAHAVYDGSLAAADRVKWYLDGAAAASGITGAIPVAMRASASPISLFNHFDGAGLAPDTDFTLLDCAVWERAFSSSEAQDDALGRTFGP